MDMIYYRLDRVEVSVSPCRYKPRQTPKCIPSCFVEYKTCSCPAAERMTEVSHTQYHPCEPFLSAIGCARLRIPSPSCARHTATSLPHHDVDA